MMKSQTMVAGRVALFFLMGIGACDPFEGQGSMPMPSPTVCPAPLGSCLGKCIDPRFDPANCGGCGIECDRGGFCNQGKCMAECAVGSLLCNEQCIDPQSDNANCGGCGMPCGDGGVCSGGHCGTARDAGGADGNCGGATGEKMMLCNGQCLDVEKDPMNCGSCGILCSKNQFCANHRCIECPLPFSNCNNSCVNTQTDPKNCNGCGGVCKSAGHYAMNCVMGSCVEDKDSCAAGWTNCNDHNGCKTDLLSSPSNCGTCGLACSPGTTCQQGVCQ